MVFRRNQLARMKTGSGVLIPFLAALVAAGCADGGNATTEVVADSIAAELLTPPPPVLGLTIAVSRDGDLVFDGAYGLADLATGRPLESSDPQRIASLSKPFTAAAVLKLVEEGRIDLDAPIQEYLPAFITQGNTVSVRNLLNHTSGIHSYSDLFAGTGRQPVPRAAVLDTLQRHPFDFFPGEAYRYSSSGYYLLGVILEEVTGESYAQHLEVSLFEPLGLDDTGYCGYGGAEVPAGYRTVGDDLEAVVLEDSDFLGGSGGLCSTGADLVNWMQALATGRVIAPTSYALMTTPTVLPSGDTVPYGFGLDIEALEHHRVIAHGGQIGGFNARMAYYPAEGLSVAVLVNTNTPKAELVQNAVARAALGMDRLVPTNLPLSAEERGQYLGTYDLGPIQLRVFEDGERLLLQPSGQATAVLLFQGDGVFLADVGRPARVEFSFEEGRATGLTLYQGSQQLEAQRIEN